MAAATATTPRLPLSPSWPSLQRDKVTSQEFHLLWSVQEDAELRGEQEDTSMMMLLVACGWRQVKAAAGQ